jgi:hypothetical protein
MTVGKKLVVSGVGCQVSAYPPAKAKAGLIEDKNFFVIQALAKEVVGAVSNRDELGWPTVIIVATSHSHQPLASAKRNDIEFIELS